MDKIEGTRINIAAQAHGHNVTRGQSLGVGWAVGGGRAGSACVCVREGVCEGEGGCVRVCVRVCV
jgi:hypothetical protein